MRINKDDIRAMCHSSVWLKANEEQVLGVRDAAINVALSTGHDVIVDDTNFAPYHLETIKKIAENYDAEVEVKFFDVPVATCIERDSARQNPVGKKAILDMFNRYVARDNRLSAEFPVIVQDPSVLKIHAVIVDIDGTVAHKGDHDGARAWYDYDRVGEDMPHKDILDLVKMWQLSTFGHVIFMSGRDDSCKVATMVWLEHHYGPTGWALFMRKTGDKRGDDVAKFDLFKEHVDGKYFIDYVIDDRDKVVRMWRQIGLRCLQVADGKF